MFQSLRQLCFTPPRTRISRSGLSPAAEVCEPRTYLSGVATVLQRSGKRVQPSAVAADFAGHWEATPQGQGTVGLDLTVKGVKVKGAFDEGSLFKGAKIKGTIDNALVLLATAKFKFALDGPKPTKITVKLQVGLTSATTFQGTAEYSDAGGPFQQDPWTGVKVV